MHPEGTKIKGTISSCCGTSVSVHNGRVDHKGEYIPHHHTCNKCGKNTQPIVKDMWVITDRGLYRPINRE